jgi:hypothetical protein
VQTAATETNVPLVVATVFAATFVAVGVIAYLILFRRSPRDADSPTWSSGAVGPSAPSGAVDVQPADAAQITLPLEHLPQSPSSVPAVTEPPPAAVPTSAEPPPDDSRRLFVTLYRALMFATGVAGLLASALMFDAVEGVSLLPFVAFGVATFSIYSIYRGFVPDAELRKPRSPTSRQS